ncbi:MAG: cation transporter, partial [Actinomycetota bacterium]|nr:cation transporter [Actinomycetota bacterium]
MHDHGPGAGRRRLAWALAITVGVLLVEAVGAAVTGSLALLADAGHMAVDALGLTAALVAAMLARR